MHEAQMHQANSFITLTYNNEHLPSDKSIHKEHLQKFFKRLRKNTGIKLRYFACGEYGEQNNRPHYHAIIFGYDFPDRQLHTMRNGNALYRSPELEKAWTFGHSLIGEVSFQSCAYVARYVMKKRKGDKDQKDSKNGLTNEEHYMLTDPETGEIFQLEPEFCLMSRGHTCKEHRDMPYQWDCEKCSRGIGYEWLQKYKSDTDKDFVTLNGVKMKLPKYYDSVIEIEDEIGMMSRKSKRRKEANKRKEDNTLDRLKVKETVKLAQTGRLKRDLEEF
jgi:hypothetical protein